MINSTNNDFPSPYWERNNSGLRVNSGLSSLQFNKSISQYNGLIYYVNFAQLGWNGLYVRTMRPDPFTMTNYTDSANGILIRPNGWAGITGSNITVAVGNDVGLTAHPFTLMVLNIHSSISVCWSLMSGTGGSNWTGVYENSAQSNAVHTNNNSFDGNVSATMVDPERHAAVYIAKGLNDFTGVFEGQVVQDTTVAAIATWNLRFAIGDSFPSGTPGGNVGAGYTYAAAVWNRALTIAEAREISFDPGMILEREVPQFWRYSLPAAAAPAGVTYPQLERHIRGLERGLYSGGL